MMQDDLVRLGTKISLRDSRTVPHVITLDSGQGSDRRKIIQTLIQYLMSIKGIRCVCLSTDSRITKAYLALLYPSVKEAVFLKGNFQIYLQMLDYISHMHELLFLNPSHNTLIYQMYHRILYPLQDALIRDLVQDKFCVILDRSRLTAHAYHASLPSFQTVPLDESLQRAKRYVEDETWQTVHFFVDSRQRLSYTIAQAKRYDLIAPELNLKLKSWYHSLQNRLTHPQRLQFIPAGLPLEQAVSVITQALDL